MSFANASIKPSIPVPLPINELPDNLSNTPAGASATASVGGAEAIPASVPDCASLSPDALMAYCQSRLNSLDTQMTGIFTSQQNNAKLTQDVNAIASTLNDLPPGSGTPPNVGMTVQESCTLQGEYAAAISDAQGSGNPQLVTSLKADEAAILTGAVATSSGFTLSGNTVSQMSQNLKNYAATLNSNSEMTMITLQSLMSQRQTAVQLTTNLVQSLGDQESSIAKNIGQ